MKSVNEYIAVLLKLIESSYNQKILQPKKMNFSDLPGLDEKSPPKVLATLQTFCNGRDRCCNKREPCIKTSQK